MTAAARPVRGPGLKRFLTRAAVHLTYWGEMGILLARTAGHALLPPWPLRLAARQIHFVGVRSVVVVTVAGLFVGMVVALQFHDTLVRFGSVAMLGSAVGLSLIRELGPVLTALIVIGRAGSATCAEIGVMRIDNQIDALECMAIDPYRFLLAPRLIAFVVSVPLLTALFDVVGIGGGWLVGVVLFNVSEGAYFQGMSDSVVPRDFLMGALKSVVFGLVIAWISAGRAFLMHREPGRRFGAEGVGQVTTRAVVSASLTVLFLDYIVSTLLL